ncbi:hypothetical protein AYL99_02974 [Fonsecaea erecta]|uniref:PNPLA domain-containing protein n=1 Tax=Fonsecaea erecta TaxID=1367422 RepID=A0A178ZVL6_9EURO|nr:hypothetical protein AYL99_02974 [Fonsecaea erecta]OAP63747.1 hypothetical protein AYL99_02974 [Fonsecaea erecta]
MAATGAAYWRARLADPWAKSVVLTLDGSAYHSLFTLYVLKDLMDRIRWVEENEMLTRASTSADSPGIFEESCGEGFKRIKQTWPKVAQLKHQESSSIYLPCHYFDYIGSTSTSSLAALLLGRLRMSAEGALACYEIFLPWIYELHRPSRMSRVKDLLDVDEMKESQVTELDRLLEDLSRQSLESDKFRCKTVVCSMAKSASTGWCGSAPHLFRSYHSEIHTWFEADISNLSIRAVTEAVACNPFDTTWTQVGDTKFCDVGFRLPNPTWLIVRDIRTDIAIKQEAAKEVGIVVSIGIQSAGTDRPKDSVARQHLPSRSNAGLNKALKETVNEVHESMKQLSTQLADLQYYRLGPDLDLGEIPDELSDTSSPEKLRHAFEEQARKFLSNEETKTELDRCARALVNLRRWRCRRLEWERFAFGWTYTCRRCPKEHPVVVKSRAELAYHLFAAHDFILDPPYDEEVNKLVEQGRSHSD